MLENDEKISDDELFDVVGSAKILRVELDAFRLFAKNTKNQMTEVTGLQLQSDFDMDESINQVILDYISFVLTQGEISEIEYKFITKILQMKYTKESLNDILNTLDSIHDTFEKQMLNVYTSRYKIFSSLDNIREYFEDSMTIKYFDHDDFDYIKKDRNLFLNIMYNNSNKDILNFLKTYSLVD